MQLANPTMNPSLFALFCALIEQETGIHYGVDEEPLLSTKLVARAQQAGFDSLLDYYYLLRYDDPQRTERDAMIDALVVPETYFFREFGALKLAISDFIVPRVRAGRRPRLWCAATATGEEPMTACMLLADQGMLDSVDVVASDLSPRMLARARAGQFGHRALRQVPDPALADRWLERTDGGVRLRADFARHVDFRRINLVDAAAVSALGRFDLVLCRNVLIYFSDDTAAGVVRRLEAALEPDGALFVGVSESLIRLGTSLVCEERAGTFFYRRVS
jgi:chemotaxis protein methyltransferase CheR